MMKLARMELDFARESLTVQMALWDEGRVDVEAVERARVEENQAWGAFYDSQYDVQKAKLNLLRQTGELVAALR
jgi:outer membrane protein TolC